MTRWFHSRIECLQFYFSTKKPDKVQRFERTVSDRFNENTKHARSFF